MEAKQNKIVPGTTIVERNYESQFEGGTKVNFTMKATIENYAESDMEDVFSFIAQSPRQFYLEVATSKRD